MVLNLYKKTGLTPLACMEQFRQAHSEYKDQKMTYAGRLDPMTEGVLIVLTGEDVHRKDDFLNLSKEYIFEVLFGFETDSFDLLGLPKEGTIMSINDEELKNVLQSFIGEHEQTYPQYSSKPVSGIPLFAHARGEGIAPENLPKRIVTIDKIEIISRSKIDPEELLKNINERIGLIAGDFRQEEIIQAWQKILKNTKQKTFDLVKINVACGSGTYVRALAYELGKKLSTSALAYSIVRIKVGEYGIEKSL